MRLAPLILFFFVATPIAEIWILISVGGILGVFPTITLVVLTAIAGTALIRHQGVGLLVEARRQLERGEPPLGAVVDSAFLLVAGALLLTPGFLTDFIGFLCLMPIFRRFAAAWLWSRFGNRFDIHRTDERTGSPNLHEAKPSGPILEGEFSEVSTDEKTKPRPDQTSPWVGGPPGK